MARFDVLVDVDGGGLLLDCQSDLLRQLNSRFCVPMLPIEAAPRPAGRLNPVFVIDGLEHVMVTQFAAAVPLRACGAVVASLVEESAVIIDALDMLISGY
ncbi:hypothetical protein GCM10007973_32450 [Polymorphobacter multimanifer]|uniref:Toxin CcdB n=1 Tax=Polymorphobacter multimanifer TaxID=1070431 RepID=A0A841LI51_9SPHN|nr:CcdB family protein [Polymorphobacter multimanifer]MBB6229485.1 toxin CcdB [Polymorphobacter multimanifer]GGI93738.1 hypothetical protein GCM10007973_32450 [Polymorphobacter multimanifer]